MRFAYADPPYLGCCALYGHFHGDDGRCWNELDTHRLLVERLDNDFPDGWAMSASSKSIAALAPMCPDARVMAWVKPFASFNAASLAFTWEPVFLQGGRLAGLKASPGWLTVRDHLSQVITLKRGTIGAKPDRFCAWVLTDRVDSDTQTTSAKRVLGAKETHD